MAENFDLILKGGTVVNHDGRAVRDVGVRDGRIVALGSFDKSQAGEVIDCTGLHVLPGVIDTQVHFREPGLEHKEDLAHGSLGAVLGGVTGVFEMPNTNPQTVNVEAHEDKIARATGRMHCDFAFFIGGTHENAAELPELERLPGCPGVKVFMGASTGNLLVEDDEGVEQILRHCNRRATFHSEDEYRMRERRGERIEGDPRSHPVWRDMETALICTKRLVNIARRTGKRIHVLHISTREEMEFLSGHKDVASVEVLGNHLTLVAPDCYERLGTFAQQNPPVRDAYHQAGLWEGVANGTVDILGSDHAPHTRAEKEKPYPASPSGMPAVQTLVPTMLNHVNNGRLTLERFVDLSSAGPNRIFGISRKGRIAAGYDADFTIVDMERSETIRHDWIASKAGWTPYDGMTCKGWPVGTIVRGRRVMWEGDVPGPAAGAPIEFVETLQPRQG